MTYRRAHLRLCVFAVITFGLVPQAKAQSWKTAVDFDRLVNERGSLLETGFGLRAALMEADTDSSSNAAYMPSAGSSEFLGKTIVDGSGLGGSASGHANSVGSLFFGNNGSLTPGVADVVSFEANNWVGQAYSSSAAFSNSHAGIHVSNHSYSGNTSHAISERILKSIDAVIDTHDMTSTVAGLSSTLISPSYNSITVGRTSATAGYATTFYGAGRSKPDIVVPASFPSTAAPMVGSAALLMHAKAQAMGDADGQRSETVKAVLMAGATKNEFPGWNRTTTKPLDAAHGAGELNVYNSYHIMEAGQMSGSTGIGSFVGSTGWDYVSTFDPNAPLSWNFTIAGSSIFSAMLNWNVHIHDPDECIGESCPPAFELANLDLRLFDATNSLIDSSLSTVDNLEHIYFESLGPGTYRLEVSGDIDTDFSLAWRSNASLVSAVPEPASTMVLLGMLIVSGFTRRSRR